MEIDARELLVFWERASRLPPVRFSLALLGIAWEGREPAEWAWLSVGERDRLLGLIRIRWFGSELEIGHACAYCGERMEGRLDLEQILAEIPEGGEPLPVELGDVSGIVAESGPGRPEGSLALRRITSEDWLALEAAPSDVDAESFLLCRSAGAALEPARARALLDDAETAMRISQAMETADPFADPMLGLACPACGREQEALLDLASILRLDCEAWANSMIADIHLLASAYGWSEGEILGLSPERRRQYKERILS